jgi:hypothetical protein
MPMTWNETSKAWTHAARLRNSFSVPCAGLDRSAMLAAERARRAVASWRGLSQALRRGTTAAVGEACAVWVSDYWCYGAYSIISFQEAEQRPRLRLFISSIDRHRLGRMVRLVHTAQF